MQFVRAGSFQRERTGFRASGFRRVPSRSSERLRIGAVISAPARWAMYPIPRGPRELCGRLRGAFASGVRLVVFFCVQYNYNPARARQIK
eukprot:3581582-Lingulodinium_polyedra.AAC.1